MMLAGAAALIVLLASTDFEGAMKYVREMGLLPVLVSVLSIHLGVFFYNLGWYQLLKRKLPFRDVFVIGWASLFVNLVVPAGSAPGEVLRAYLASKRGLNGGEALSSVIAHRIIMIVPFVVSVALGMSYALTGESPLTPTQTAVIIGLMALAVLILIAVSRSERPLLALVGLAERIFRRDMHEAREAVVSYVKSFRELTADKKTLASSMVSSFLNWLFDMMPIFILFWAAGRGVSPLYVAFVYSISIIMILVPLGIPGNTGVREWVMVLLLTSTGIEEGLALAITLLASTVVVFLNELIFGFFMYMLALKMVGRVRD
ncbi:MAG TPA: flippase-like domain-containing protein [Candidatus Korarchaeota archaeon]|nr:flippase-like domain-containing protein [Candidatus Korarchaeota archaeon]